MSRRWVLGGLGVAAVAIVGGAIGYATTRYPAGQPQSGYLALTGAAALVGDRLARLPDATVLVKDGVIEAVGTAQEIEIPSAAEVVHLGGHSVLPGLIDLHVHLGSAEQDQGAGPGVLSMPRLVADWIRHMPGTRRALLQHGVTTVRSLGDEHEWITELRHLISEGELEGPRVFAAGPIFTTTGGHPVATFGADPGSDLVRVPVSADEARTAVRELAAGPDRVDLIKVVQERGRPERPLEPIAPDTLAAIVDEAHAQGLAVTAHWGTLDDLHEVLDAGVDGLEHLEARGITEGGWPADVLDRVVDGGIVLAPTLAVTDAAPIPAPAVEDIRRRAAEFHDAGGRLVVGSDAPMQGVPFGAGVHQELELLVECGLSPQEALRAATSEAVKVLGTDRFGSIEPGRAADLVVVSGDPLDDITKVRAVTLVFRDGRLVVDHRDER